MSSCYNTSTNNGVRNNLNLTCTLYTPKNTSIVRILNNRHGIQRGEMKHTGELS